MENFRPASHVYEGLAPEVENALRELNGFPLDCYIRENRPVCYRNEDGSWTTVYPAGELTGLNRLYKEALEELGVEIEWRNDLLLYVVKR